MYDSHKRRWGFVCKHHNKGADFVSFAKGVDMRDCLTEEQSEWFSKLVMRRSNDFNIDYRMTINVRRVFIEVALWVHMGDNKDVPAYMFNIFKTTLANNDWKQEVDNRMHIAFKNIEEQICTMK